MGILDPGAILFAPSTVLIVATLTKFYLGFKTLAKSPKKYDWLLVKMGFGATIGGSYGWGQTEVFNSFSELWQAY